MSAAHPPTACRRCGREPAEGKLDSLGWCAECRGEVVRRATPAAYAAAVVAAAAYLAVMGWAGGFASTFAVFLLALGAILAFLVFKVARRVAFDLVRARPPRTPA